MSILRVSALLLLLLAVLARSQQDASALAADLQAKLDRYQKDLLVLQQQVEQVRGELNKVKAQPSLGFASVQEGMANQRDLLYTIQDYLTLPFNITSCDCYELSDNQRQRVLKRIASIKQGLESLQSNVGLDQKCRQYVKVRKELQRQQRYIESVEAALTNAGCGKQLKRRETPVPAQTPSGIANIAQSEFQTNLKAENLCYGRLTEKQVKLLWFAFSVKNNVTNCPMSAPFYDGAKCISCPARTPFFDLSLQRCIAAKGVDENKQCIDPSLEGISKGGKEVSATLKEVAVNPLVDKPIVKSITFSKERRSREKVVSAIEGKALVDKQKRVTSTKYVQVAPIVTPPDVKYVKAQAQSQVTQASQTRDEQVAPQVTEPVVSTQRVRRSSAQSSTSSSSRSSNSRAGAQQGHQEQV